VCADRQSAYGLERFDRFDEAIAEQLQTLAWRLTGEQNTMIKAIARQ